MAGRRLSSTLVAVALALSLVGCSTAQGGDAAQVTREGAAGLRLSGTVEGRQVAVRDGSPELIFGDCDPTTPPDQDLCVISQTVGGELFVLVFENPDVLESDAGLVVEPSRCRGPECDEVAGDAVVDVQLGGGSRIRAVSGEVELDGVTRFVRYTGRLRLDLPDGRLSGRFDLVPSD